VIEFQDPESHEMHAKEGGYDTVGEAIEAGWVRGFEYRDRLALDVMDISDESTFSMIVKFLEKVYAESGPFNAVIDFALPKHGFIYLYAEEMGEESIPDLLRLGLRRA
jgi:hypothetical protein